MSSEDADGFVVIKGKTHYLSMLEDINLITN
jgi:hypothetical protein